MLLVPEDLVQFDAVQSYGRAGLLYHGRIDHGRFSQLSLPGAGKRCIDSSWYHTHIHLHPTPFQNATDSTRLSLTSSASS